MIKDYFMEQTFQELEDFYDNNKCHLGNSWLNLVRSLRDTVQYKLTQATLNVMLDTHSSSKQTIEILVDSKQRITIKGICKCLTKDRLLDRVTIISGMQNPEKVELLHSGLIGVNALSHEFEIISDGRQLNFKNRKLVLDEQCPIREEITSVSFCLVDNDPSFKIEELKQLLKEYTYLYLNLEFHCNEEKISSPNGLSDFVLEYNLGSCFCFKNDFIETVLNFTNDKTAPCITFINNEFCYDNNFSLASIRKGILRAINQYFSISLNKYEIPSLVVATCIKIDAKQNKLYPSVAYYRIFDIIGFNEKVENEIYQQFIQYLQLNPQDSSILKRQIDKHLEDRYTSRHYSLSNYVSINVNIKDEEANLDIIHNGNPVKNAHDIILYKLPKEDRAIIDEVIDVLERLIDVPSRICFDFNDLILTIKDNKRIAVVSGKSNTYNSCHLEDAIKDALKKAKLRNINVFECNKLLVNIKCYPQNIEGPVFSQELNTLHYFFQKFPEEVNTMFTISPEPHYSNSKNFGIDILLSGI